MKGGKPVVEITITKNITTEVITTVITSYLEVPRVQKLSQQKQSKENTGITSLERSGFLTQQKAMV
jgi:hypothetical protein